MLMERKLIKKDHAIMLELDLGPVEGIAECIIGKTHGKPSPFMFLIQRILSILNSLVI